MIFESLPQPTCRRIMICYFVPCYCPRNNEGNKIIKPMKGMAKGKEHTDNSVSVEFYAALKVDILLTVYYIWKIRNTTGNVKFFFCEDLMLLSDDILSSLSST